MLFCMSIEALCKMQSCGHNFINNNNNKKTMKVMHKRNLKSGIKGNVHITFCFSQDKLP